MYNTLKELLNSTVAFIDGNYTDKQIAFACNSEYGQVFVSLNLPPKSTERNDFWGEEAEKYYWFGDWDIPDVRDVHPELNEAWDRKWSKFQTIIRDDWIDLSSFEEKYNRELFLESVCQIAASINRDVPILVADHDEHISYTVNRQKRSYLYNEKLPETFLTSKKWLSKDEPDFLNHLAFFTSGRFINACEFLDSGEEIVFEGEWTFHEKELSMILYEANIEDFEHYGRKDIFSIVDLTEELLKYKDIEQEWNFSKIH